MNITKFVSLSQRAGLIVAARRNIGASYVLASAAAAKPTDPIQQLFVSKLREYSSKKKQSGGALLDATPEFQAKVVEDLARVDRVFGVKGKPEDFTKFPTLAFKDEKAPAINVEYKEDLTFDVKIPVVTVKSDPDKATFEHLM